ncbi:MAG: SBBP repeat-containing protein [Armatimonadota bacterium]
MSAPARAPWTLLLTLIGGAATLALPGGVLQPLPATSAPAAASLARVPLYFVENRGQAGAEVLYSTRGSEADVGFTRTGVRFTLRERSGSPPRADAALLRSGSRPAAEAALEEAERRWTLGVEFVDSNPAVEVVGSEPAGCVFSFFRGEQADWQSGVPSFLGVRYREVWPGIDLVYRGDGSALKYQFEVQPGADPSVIRLRVRGAERVKVDDAGRLRLENPIRTVVDEAPMSFTQAGGSRAAVSSAYRVEAGPGGDPVVSFRLGAYDSEQTLVIDPTVLLYCGYLGGAADESAHAIAVDRLGYAYVCGTTSSSELQGFPVTFGPSLVKGTSQDAFVARVRPDGAGLLYCGYIGGHRLDSANAIAVDQQGSAYLCGITYSAESQGFPARVGPDLTFNGPLNSNPNAWVAKLNSKGDVLEYCGYIGGGWGTRAQGIAVDQNGAAYVCGWTLATEYFDFPVKTGPDLQWNNGLDAWVAKLRPSGAALEYCGYIGGGDDDYASSIAVDQQGAAYVCGWTSSAPASGQGPGFPVSGGLDTTFAGWTDGFVAKVLPNGTGLAYCGYLGGSGSDWAQGIAIDSVGAAYLCGTTLSSPHQGFPALVGPELVYGGNFDAFVAKVQPGGSGLEYCGYLGGAGADYGESIAVDGQGGAYVCGTTWSSSAQGFPALSGPDLSHNGGSDLFVARIQPGGTGLVYAGYIGGSDDETGEGIALDTQGVAHVCGTAYSTPGQGFPVVNGPGATHSGGEDAFVAKVGFAPFGPPSNLTLTAHAATVLHLSWLDRFQDGGGFQIERRIGGVPADWDGDGFETIATVAAGTESYRDFGLSAETTYTYRVRAVSAMGASPYSNLATITTPAAEGVLRLTPGKISFGRVTRSRTRVERLKARNTGKGPLALQVQSLGEPFSVSPTGPVVLGPKQSQELVVTFTPQNAGSFRQTLEIASDDPARPLVRVPVSGSRR